MSPPRKILIFQNRFRVGGQERQTVLNVRSMDTAASARWWRCLHLDGEHLQDLEAAGVRPVVFEVGQRCSAPNRLAGGAPVARFIRDEGIRVVHCQDVYTNVLGTLAAGLAGSR